MIHPRISYHATREDNNKNCQFKVKNRINVIIIITRYELGGIYHIGVIIAQIQA